MTTDAFSVQKQRGFLDFIHLFLERGGGRESERERNISVREKHLSVASLRLPHRGPYPQPRRVS